MPVDYSKWDALELSDDSDFEPHPNVDKRSFIRAKQTQIHQQRADRKLRIETLKYERVVNDGLLRRIDTLVAELKSREAEARSQSTEPSAFLFQALIASSGDPAQDEAPKPPAGVHAREPGQDGGGPIRYSQMMGSLADQVKKEVEEAKPQDWYMAYVRSVEGHRHKVQDLQKNLAVELAALEKEEGSKITSESIRDGFNSSHVSKGAAPDAKAKEGGKGKSKGKVEKVEVLNPAALKKKSNKDLVDDSLNAPSSGAEADIDEDGGALADTVGSRRDADDDDDNDNVEPSELGKQFARIPEGDYQTCLGFIAANRGVLAERETDGLLVLGFEAQLEGKERLAHQCVHHALLLQYCRTLGPDGVQLFFRRITTKDHQARRVFLDDVQATYARIRSRCQELNAERAARPQDSAGVEQIQLQTVEPGSSIHINVPDPESTDEPEMLARKVFDTFPPNFRKALETGELDRVNEVLGRMSVDEAEEIVAQLGDSGMLDMRQGVIDGTTEEGQETLRKMKGGEELGAVQEEEEGTAGAPDPE